VLQDVKVQVELPDLLASQALKEFKEPKEPKV
jgi:hypothetical protein